MSTKPGAGRQDVRDTKRLERVLLDRLSSIDPVFSIDQQQTRVLAGLYTRAHNDTIPLRFAPGQPIGQRSLDSVTLDQSAALWFGPGQSRRTALVRFTVSFDRGGLSELSFPLVTEDDIGGEYFNWRIRPEGTGCVNILEIDDAKRLISVGEGPRGERQSTFLSGEGLEIALRAGVNFAFYTSGRTSQFLVGFTCVAVQPESATLLVRLREGSVAALEMSGDAMSEVTLSIFVHPDGERLVAGSPTFSLNPSPLAAAVFDPFSVRVMNWLFAVLTPFDAPLTDPVVAPPKLEQPFVTFGLDQGLVVPGASNVRGWFDMTEALIMVGNPVSSLLDQIVASQRYRCLTLISTSGEVVDRVLKANGGVLGADQDEPTVRWSKAPECTVIGAVVDDQASSRAVMESAIAECGALCRAGSQELQQRAAAIRKAQRPSLPYNADLVVAMVSLVGNMARGRLPEDDGSNVPDYSVYARDELWLIPWNSAIGTGRSRLLLELNLRLASEWLATRACVELYGKGEWKAADANAAVAAVAASGIRQAFHGWLPGGLSLAARTEPADRRAAVLARAGITPSAALRIVAQAAYEVCSASGEYSGFDSADEGLSFANPVVLVLTSGGDQKTDGDLNINIGYWASVAARTGGAKGGIVVPTFLAPGALDKLRDLQVEIRRTVVEQGDSTGARRSVAAARQELGQALRDCLEPATEALLALLNPDRVIVFSDVVFDCLPYRRSVLGFEKPSCRLPAHGHASQYVAQMVAASRRSLKPRWRRRAAIVTSPQIDDDVTAWAVDVAELLEQELARVGQAAVRPVQPGASVASVLDAMDECSMVFFIGHGTASDTTAALDIGVGVVEIDALRNRDWADKFICLIGCETATIDGLDIASAFLTGGARAIIGTLTQIRLDVARVFFGALMRYSAEGSAPLDYAFFGARCEAALYEILLGIGQPIGEATGAEAAALFVRNGAKFAAALDELNLKWSAVQDHVLFSLSLTMLGGAGDMLV